MVSNFCCVLNAVFFPLGDSPASEFYVPTFRDTLSIPLFVFFLLGDSPESEFYVQTFRNTLPIPYVVFFLLGDSPASKFYVPTFRDTLSIPLVVFFLLGDSPASEFNVPTFRNTLSVPFSNTRAMTMEQNVPKRRNIKFKRWGITQRKEYNITAYFLTVSHGNMADFRCLAANHRTSAVGHILVPYGDRLYV